MFCKSKYCGNCSREIEETGRNPLSSGRYCIDCQDAFKVQEWLPRIIICCSVLFGLFGFGSFLYPSEKSLNLSAKRFSESAPSQKESAKESKTQPSGNSNVRVSADSNNRTAAEKQTAITKNGDAQPEREISKIKVSDSEPTFFCGAATKKGNPCSRRVKGGGRCWQHAGQNAILSPDKLIVSR